MDDELLDRMRHRDQDAWSIFFDVCFPRLVARIRLDGSVRRRYDREDLISEAFCRLVARFDDYDFDTAASVYYYLALVVDRLAIEKRRQR